MIVWLVKWCKIQEIHRHSGSLIYIDSHSQALFPFTKITVQLQDWWIQACLLIFTLVTIPFNFIEWFMILFFFSDVKYSLSIFCVEYVLTKNNFAEPHQKGPQCWVTWERLRRSHIPVWAFICLPRWQNDSSLCQGIAQWLYTCLTWLKH